MDENVITFNKIINLDDIVFARYLLSLSNDKISVIDKERYAKEYIALGHNLALEFKGKTIEELIKDFHLNVRINDESNYKIDLACFKTTNKIFISETNINRVYKKLNRFGIVISLDKIKEVALAYALYYYLKYSKNSKYKLIESKSIYLSNLKSHSKMNTIDDIAALSFARELTDLNYSQYVFNIVLYSCIDKDKFKRAVFELIEEEYEILDCENF